MPIFGITCHHLLKESSVRRQVIAKLAGVLLIESRCIMPNWNVIHSCVFN